MKQQTFSDIEFTKIKSYLDEFAQKRGWCELRNPKNLSMALSVEVAELTELFQWLNESQSKDVINNEKVMQNVREELADILSYLIQVAGVLSIDLNQAFWEKTMKNEAKYPENL